MIIIQLFFGFFSLIEATVIVWIGS